VKKLITIEDQMNTLSSKILEQPGIGSIEKEYNNIMQGKFICLNILTIIIRLQKLCIVEASSMYLQMREMIVCKSVKHLCC